MITQIDLSFFKSFLADTLYFRPLTLLTGLNSSGKSSVIQALRLAEQAVGFHEQLLLQGHGDLSEFKNPYAKTLDDLQIAVSLSNGETIRIGGAYPIQLDIPFPDLLYVAADRFGPEVSVPIFAGDNYTMGHRGENMFKIIEYFSDEPLPEAIRHEAAEGNTFGYNLEAWLSVISPNTRLKTTVSEKSDSSYSTFNGFRAKNVGFGLSYTLPIITALLQASITPHRYLLILENPEAHLHPRGQTEIARLIAKAVEAGCQVIVETHSDHIINGIRIHAKESDSAFHEKVQIYWFELDQNRNTVSTEIHLDKNGRSTEYPEGFFDQFEINARKLI